MYPRYAISNKWKEWDEQRGSNSIRGVQAGESPLAPLMPSLGSAYCRDLGNGLGQNFCWTG